MLCLIFLLSQFLAIETIVFDIQFFKKENFRKENDYYCCRRRLPHFTPVSIQCFSNSKKKFKCLRNNLLAYIYLVKRIIFPVDLFDFYFDLQDRYFLFFQPLRQTQAIKTQARRAGFCSIQV